MWGKDKVRAADFVFLGEDRAPILQCLGVIPTQSELPLPHLTSRPSAEVDPTNTYSVRAVTGAAFEQMLMDSTLTLSGFMLLSACASLPLSYKHSWLSSALISIIHFCDPRSFPVPWQIFGSTSTSMYQWLSLRLRWASSPQDHTPAVQKRSEGITNLLQCVYQILCWTPHFWASLCYGFLWSGARGYISATIEQNRKGQGNGTIALFPTHTFTSKSLLFNPWARREEGLWHYPNQGNVENLCYS